jgi:hypothetical protein
MNRIAIVGAGLAVLALSSPIHAQAARDSALHASAPRSIVVTSPLVTTVLAASQGDNGVTRWATVPERSTRQRLVRGALTGLAVGAIGLTVRDLAQRDRSTRSRNLGTDGAILISSALLGALVNYTIHVREPGERPDRP